MHYICDKTFVKSIVENLYEKKYIKQNGKLYEFHIKDNSLMVNVYSDAAPPLLIETYTLETNMKGEFSICEDERNIIHIVAANKKYDLIYIHFDGEHLKKETIYAFNNNFTIPTTPVIQVKNNLIAIVLEFLTTGVQKEWSLQAYIKRNDIWDHMIIDNGTGLCYIQPDFKLDEQMNLHVTYREFREKSYLKYTVFDVQRPRSDQEMVEIIMDSEIDKYDPSIFINRSNEIFVSWIELNENVANLCSTNIITAKSKEIFKVDITQNLSDARIYFSGVHIYCIFQNQEGYCYDLCCRKRLIKEWNPLIIPKEGGVTMSSDFRQFLDIKRELEYRITELKNKADTDQYEKIIAELKHQNIELIKQISEKDKTLKAALKEDFRSRPKNEEKSIWSSILHFFSD